MASIQKNLVGLGMDNMAHRNIRIGRTKVRIEAETMWLRIMTK